MRLCIVLVLIITIAEYGNSERITIPGLGAVVGTETQSTWSKRPIYSFYGIRYAKPPSGPRRFMPPEAVDPWEGDYNATKSRRSCPQLKSRKKNYTGHNNEDFEDCLFVNVFTPLNPKQINNTNLLPVMVYFHGGGFYENSAKSFPPNYLLEEDIVLVVPQYRLGPLGFLSLQTNGISGNFGFMDMVGSLVWVQRRIGAFGGDKTRVTIVGQSAGAASNMLMLMSPLVSDSLFHQAILQSGSATSSWVTNEDPLSFANTYYHELTNTTEAVDLHTMEEGFRNATVQELHQALLQAMKKDPLIKSSKLVLQEAGNFKFLEDHPVDLLRIGHIRTVPMMTGVTKHDGSFIVTLIFKVLQLNNLLDNSNYLRNNLTRDVIQLFDIADDTWALTDMLESKYFADLFKSKDNITFVDVVPGLIDICGLLFFKSAVFRQAKINANHSPTYLYTFDYAGEHTRFGYGEDTSDHPFEGGIHHSDDLLYLFPYHYDELNKEDLEVARTMVDLWTSFVISGIPTSPNSEPWQPFNKGLNGPYLHINQTSYMDDDFPAHEYRTY